MSGLIGRVAGRFGQATEFLAPMRNKELFLRRKKCLGFPNNRPQCRRHLKNHEDKDDDPGVQPSRGSRVRVGKRRFKKTQAKEDGDKPE